MKNSFYTIILLFSLLLPMASYGADKLKITVEPHEKEAFRDLQKINLELEEIHQECFGGTGKKQIKASMQCLCNYRDVVSNLKTIITNLFLGLPQWENATVNNYIKHPDGSVTIQVANTENIVMVLSYFDQLNETCPDKFAPTHQFNCDELGKSLKKCTPYECKGEFARVGEMKHQVVGDFEGACIYYEESAGNRKICNLDQENQKLFGDYYHSFYRLKYTNKLGEYKTDQAGGYYQDGTEILRVPSNYFNEQICKQVKLGTK